MGNATYYIEMWKSYLGVLRLLSSLPALAISILALLPLENAIAQEVNRVEICANAITDSPDCLLDFLQDLDDPYRAGMPSSLAATLQFDEANRESVLSLILTLYREMRPPRDKWKDTDKWIFQAAGQSCKFDLYERLSGELVQLGRDGSLYPLYFLATLGSCRNFSAGDLSKVETILSNPKDDFARNNGLIWLIQYYAAFGMVDTAIERVHQLFAGYDPEADEFSGVQLRYGPVAGNSVAFVVNRLLAEGRVETALELTQFHLRRQGDPRFYLSLGKRAPATADPNSFLDFANRIDNPMIAEFSRNGGIFVHLRRGELTDALQLLRDLGPGKSALTQYPVYKALITAGRNTEANALAADFGLTPSQPSPSSQPSKLSRWLSLRERVMAHDWTAVSAFIANQPKGNDRLDAIQRVGYWTLLDKARGGPSLSSARRSLEYFRRSYPLFEERGGHQIPLQRFNQYWLYTKDAVKIISTLERSGLFEPVNLRHQKTLARLKAAFQQEDVGRFSAAVDTLDRGDFEELRLGGQFCSRLESASQADMCLTAIERALGSGMSKPNCYRVLQYLAYGKAAAAVRTLGFLSDPRIRARCAISIWAELK